MKTETRPRQLGKFLLTERLGRGGMAEVWKAHIVGPMGYARKVVVKRVLPELLENARFVDLFVHEARLSAYLNHSNIVQVYEFGSIDGEFFLAMEYVHGKNLAAVLRAVRPITMPPVGLAAYVGRELCRALAYAHSLATDEGVPLRIIHRDVSPSNVMLGFDGAVKLLDFGIAKALAEHEEKRVRPSALKGKIGYVSPELVDGELEIDPRADLFSTGVLLWEMLAGRRLFRGASDVDVLSLVRRAEVPAPSVFNPEVPEDLERICLRMLARDRDHRHASCEQAGAELDEVVHRLKWSAERLAHFMRQAFPNAVDSITQPLRPCEREEAIASEAAGGEPIDPKSEGPAWDVPSSRRVAPRKSGNFSSASVVLAIKRRWGRALAAGLLTTAAAVASFWWMASPSSGLSAAAPRFETRLSPASLSSSLVTVRVVSQPAGAEVRLDEEPVPRGRTPLELKLPRGEVSHRVLLSARGYRPAVAELTPVSDHQLHFALERERKPRHR